MGFDFGWKGTGKRALEFPDGAPVGPFVGLSPVGRGRLRYNRALNRFEQSLNGGAYVAFAGGGGAPGAPDTSVQFNDGGAFAGSAAFTFDGTDVLVENDILSSGNIVFDNLSAHVIEVADTTTAETAGNGLSILAGDGGDSAGGAPGIGGGIIINGAAGGAGDLLNPGAPGGPVNIAGGTGGAIGGDAGGAGADVTIDGGPTGGAGGVNGDVLIGQFSVRNIQYGSSAANMTGTHTMLLTSDLANALAVTDPTTAARYLDIDTNTGSESVEISNSVTNPSTSVLGTGAISLGESGASIGFLGAAAITRPTITGSRGGNAALADLLTDMALLGLIVDSTSA